MRYQAALELQSSSVVSRREKEKKKERRAVDAKVSFVSHIYCSCLYLHSPHLPPSTTIYNHLHPLHRPTCIIHSLPFTTIYPHPLLPSTSHLTPHLSPLCSFFFSCSFSSSYLVPQSLTYLYNSLSPPPAPAPASRVLVLSWFRFQTCTTVRTLHYIVFNGIQFVDIDPYESYS